MLRVYEKPSCSTCRKLRELLDERGIAFERIDLFRQRFDEPALLDVFARSGLGPRAFLRTGTRPELVHAPELSDGELTALMAADPELIQRPIVIGGDGRVVLARPAERVLELLDADTLSSAD